MSQPTAWTCLPDAHGRCITCSDDVQRATVLHVDPQRFLAQAEIEGQTLEIDVSLVNGVQKGDVLLVHGGVALERERSIHGEQR